MSVDAATGGAVVVLEPWAGGGALDRGDTGTWLGTDGDARVPEALHRGTRRLHRPGATSNRILFTRRLHRPEATSNRILFTL